MDKLINQLNPYAMPPNYKKFGIVILILLSLGIGSIVVANINADKEKEDSKKDKTISLAQRSTELKIEPNTGAGLVQEFLEQASVPVQNSLINQTDANPKLLQYEEPKFLQSAKNAAEDSETQAMQASARIPTPRSHTLGDDGTLAMPQISGMPNIGNMPSLQELQKMAEMTNPNLEKNSHSSDQNVKFAQQKSNYYWDAEIQKARSMFELKAGSTIPAMMTHGINSDLPGELSAMVTENVYNSTTGEYILIPQGTKLNGVYNAQVNFGQKRLMAVWNRLVFPDGSTFDLGAMAGADQDGKNGLTDKVNHHYLRTFGSAILTAVIGSGMQLSQPKDRSNNGNDAQETITANIAEKTGSAAQGVLGKMLNVQPTLEIEAGYRFNVKVNKDLVIEG